MAKVVTISVKEADVDVWRQFVSIARVEGRSASEIVMGFVREYVSKRTRNPAATRQSRTGVKP